MATHNIVVIGASYAGLGTAHYLLRHTIPALEAANTTTTYKLTLISAPTHFYHKVAAPRLLASPDLIPLSKAFLPIADGFTQYPASRFSLVIGTATALNESEKSITVSPNPHNDDDDADATNAAATEQTTINYDTIILATGASSSSTLWSIPGSHHATISALKTTQSALPQAKTVLIAGGGPAGTETAGEIASLYPHLSTTLLSGSTRLVTRLRPAIGAAAEAQLAALGVKVEHNLRVTSTTSTSATEEASSSQTTTVHLSDSTTRTIDIYIPATGISPNTAFLPRAWLTEKNYVITADTTSLRGPRPGVYAIGDVAGYSLGGALDIIDAVRPLCATIRADLAPDAEGLKAQPFKQTVTETQLVPIGPKGGVGSVFGWRVPSFVVWMIKSRDYMIGMVPGVVSGEKFVKA